MTEEELPTGFFTLRWTGFPHQVIRVKIYDRWVWYRYRDKPAKWISIRTLLEELNASDGTPRWEIADD